MSVKIFAVPEEFKNVPNIFKSSYEEYDKVMSKWYSDLKKWTKKRNPHENQNYIGEIVR